MPQIPPSTSRRGVLAGLAGLTVAGSGLVACGRKKEEARPEAAAESTGPAEGTLEWAVAGDWRQADRSRDVWLHPIETLRFFDLRPGLTIVDFWPGVGWWTEVLAPYQAKNEGVLAAASFEAGPVADPAAVAIVERFRQRFSSNRALYGDVVMTSFGPTTAPPVQTGTADLALFMLTLHTWMSAGIAEKAFADAFQSLKPGGTLGIVQHRADTGGVQDAAASSGYIQEAYVKQLAAEAGFAFIASSEINANPKDTKDHPFGVDTLPPRRLTAPLGEPANPQFDRAKYDAIGESDRMTLKFRKPS
jgi:predicted methyltransferase